MGILGLWVATSAGAQPLPPVRAAQAGGVQTLTTTLPGELLRAVPARNPQGRPGLALLVAAGKAKSLLFLDPAKPALERLAGNLHEEVNVLVAHGETAVVGMPGVLFAPEAGGGVRRILEEPHLDLRSVAREDRMPPAPLDGLPLPWIPAARAGLVELLASGPGGALSRVASFPLPQKAERKRWGIRLVSPPVSVIPGVTPLLAVGPEEHGRRRFKTVLIDPAGGEPVESWSLLPSEERLMNDWRYLRLDGRPALAVTTLEKLGIFVQKRFRLFFLDRDRSRKGIAPALAVPTDCALWHPLEVVPADADGDGRKDLALVHPEGMNGGALQLLVSKNLGNGRFEPKPRKAKLGIAADDWRYGTDWTGDGVPDLLVLSGGKLNLYPGEAGSRPVSSRAAWSLTVGPGPVKKKDGPPPKEEDGFDEDAAEDWRARDLEILDVDGDGKPEAVARKSAEGKTTLTVVRR